MQTLRINVTQKDIDEGIQFDCENCAIARACKRQLKERKFVGIQFYEHKAAIRVGGRFSGIELPQKVDEFVRQFDNNKKKVKPISFNITIADKYIK